jgi:hypothetical protein
MQLFPDNRLDNFSSFAWHGFMAFWACLVYRVGKSLLPESAMRKPYIKHIFSYSMVGSLGLTIVSSLQGCGGDQPPTPPKDQAAGAISEATKGEGVFMVIQQTGKNPDTFELKEKYPASETRAILKDMEGKERILTQDELKKMAEEEAKKVEDGTSALAKEATAENQGLSLGETILASAAGALVGGMIANKLMGNSNYQQHQQHQQQRAQTSISRPAGGMDTRGVNQGASQPKSGFFGGNSASGGSTSGGFTGSSSVGG